MDIVGTCFGLGKKVLMMSIMWASCTVAKPMEVHIATDGDDANSGALEFPIATLERARDIIREMRGDAENFSGATVIVHPGRYPIEQTITLDERDSGSADAPITYKASVRGSAILDGAVKIDPQDFEPVKDPNIIERVPAAARPHLLQLDLRALGIDDYGSVGPRGWGQDPIPAPAELILDGEVQVLAGWPNDGYIPLGEVIDPGAARRHDRDGSHHAIFKYNTSRAERWLQAEDMYISGLFGVAWAQDMIGVASIDIENETITTKTEHFYGFAQPGQSGVTTQYRVLNLIEEIELPGEYYIDRETGILYFYPPYPLHNSLIRISRLRHSFISMRGTSHVTISGLTFDGGRGRAILMLEGDSNQLLGCTMRNLGHHAILASQGRDHRIVGCNIYNTGRGGIAISGGHRETLEESGHLVANCDIHRYNRWPRHYNPAVSVAGVGVRVENNHIHSAQHPAIVFQGNEHIIARNEIHRVVQGISDMGSIYVGRNPTYAGNLIKHNFFHQLDNLQEGGPGVQAIFFDSDSIYTARLFGNIFYRAGSTGSIKFHGGGGASIANNIAVDGPPLVQFNPGEFEGMERAISKMRTDEPFQHGFPQMIEDMNISEDPYRSRYPYIYKSYSEGYNKGTARWNNYETSSLDHFKDARNLDFTIRESSPILYLKAENIYDTLLGYDGENRSFENIPFAEIGLRQDEHRPHLGPLKFSKLGPADGWRGDGERSVQLWWQSSANADAYEVLIARDAELTEVVARIETDANYIMLEEDLERGETYYWQVHAKITQSKSNRAYITAEEYPWTFTR